MNDEQIKAVKSALKTAEWHEKTGINHNPKLYNCTLCIAFDVCIKCPLVDGCITPTRKASTANRRFYAKVVEILQEKLNENEKDNFTK